MSKLPVTPVTHQLCTSVLDLMQVQPHHTVTYRQTGYGGPGSGMDCQQDGMGFPVDVLFDFQHMYISRRGDTVGPPVWKSTILHIFRVRA